MDLVIYSWFENMLSYSNRVEPLLTIKKSLNTFEIVFATWNKYEFLRIYLVHFKPNTTRF